MNTQPSKKYVKNDLVEYIQKHTELKKSEIAEVVNLLFFILGEKLIEGAKVEIRNFGVFEVRNRKARKNARNPKTGILLDIDAYKTIFFKPGKQIKHQLKSDPHSTDHK